MKPEHESFIEMLRRKDPGAFLPEVLREHWSKGKKYYIDTRVNIRGHRRTFNRLNKDMKGE